MANIMTIAELFPGVKFTACIYLRKSVEVRTAKNGQYLQLILSDASGQKTAKKWQATQEEISTATASQFLSISGSVEEHGQYKGDVKIDLLVAADEPEDLDIFLAPLPKHYKDHSARFEALLLSVREPNLRQLLDKIFDKEK